MVVHKWNSPVTDIDCHRLASHAFAHSNPHDTPMTTSHPQSGNGSPHATRMTTSHPQLGNGRLHDTRMTTSHPQLGTQQINISSTKGQLHLCIFSKLSKISHKICLPYFISRIGENIFTSYDIICSLLKAVLYNILRPDSKQMQ